MSVPGRVWLVPGFMGSELYQDWPPGPSRPRGGHRRLFLDLATITNEAIQGALVEPPDVDDDSVINTRYVAGGVVNNGSFVAGSAMEGLRSHLVKSLPDGYEVRTFFYDWRQGALALGDLFKQEILRQPAADTGDYVVAYSYGGLVALAAWGLLKAASQESRIARIITLAAPLFGTYSPGKVWAEQLDDFSALTALEGATRGGLLTRTALGLVGLPNSPAGLEALKRNLMRAFSSWPAVYDLLPSPSKEDDAGDTNRALIWGPTSWAAALAPPSAELFRLASGSTGWHTYWANTSNRPPASVLVNVVARSGATARRLRPALGLESRDARQALSSKGMVAADAATLRAAIRRYQLPTFENWAGGDGIVTTTSQQLPGYAFFNIDSEHTQVPSNPDLLANIATLLSDSFPAGQQIGLPSAHLTKPASASPRNRIPVLVNGLVAPPPAVNLKPPAVNLAVPLRGNPPRVVPRRNRPHPNARRARGPAIS